MTTSSKAKLDTVTRRGFLRNSAIIGGAAAASTLAGPASAREEEAAARGTGKKQGYRETPHIREYYEKARI